MKWTHGVGEWVLLSLVIAMCCATPIAIVAGWVRWVRSTEPRTVFSVLSLSAFVLATASALLAISSGFYAHAIGGFRFYDPRLMRIFGWGFLLSGTGVLLSIAGIVRRNPLRYYAPACSVGTLVFWFMSAMGE
jgi:hypothetical protein